MLVPLMNATFMPPLTRHPARETTRKHGGPLALLCAVMILLAPGCATPGSNHLYTAVLADTAIHDRGPSAAATVPRVLNAWERALGLAYDYNTDHLFLRIWPRQIIRVVERPSGKILREMPLPPDLHTANAADIAIRSSNRHLFAVHSDGRTVVELTLFGEFVRRIALPDIATVITGLAFDQQADRLLVLSDQTIHVCALVGRTLRSITLTVPVHSVSLGYESDSGHFFVPLQDGRQIGEFDDRGALRQSLPAEGASEITALDAGPRSLVRVF